MKIRAANRTWRQGFRSLGPSSSYAFPSMFEPRHFANGRIFDRFVSTEYDNYLNQTTYEVNRDYKSEMTKPSLRYGSEVMSFGDGSSGALGHHQEGYFGDSFVPEIVKGLPPNIMKISAGHYHSLAVTKDGEVWAWGRNSEGQLGPRDKKSRQEWDQPQRVKGLEDVEVEDVAGSGVMSMALAKDGSLWSWGSSKRGQLGLNHDVIQSRTPQQLVALAGYEVSEMALGWGHALVCTTRGELFAWGYAADGRLGFIPQSECFVQEGCMDMKVAPQAPEGWIRSQSAEDVDRQVSEILEREKCVAPVWEPHQVEGIAHERVAHVACGMDHSLALTETGKLYSFGDNSLGQLGRHKSTEIVEAIEFPDGMNKVLYCAAGLGHSFAIAVNPRLHSSVKRPPQSPPGLTKLVTKREKDIDKEVEGSLYSWGWNSASQLGRDGDPSLPGLVEGLEDEKLVRLAAGRVHSAGLSSKRRVFTWGHGNNGRLGLDSPSNEPHPFPVEGLGFWRTLQVACGFDHSLLLVRTLVHTPGKGLCDAILKNGLGS